MAERYEPQLVKPVETAQPPSLDSLLAEKFFEGGPERLDQIIRQTRNFAVLHEVSKRMQREHDPKQMLAAVLDLVLEVTHATRGYVALLDDQGALRIEVTRNRGPRPTPGQTFAISQTVKEHVVGRRCGVICRDAAADERFQSAESLFLSDVRSLMAVPIVVSDRVRGMIEVESSHLKARFSEGDLDLLTVIASTRPVPSMPPPIRSVTTSCSRPVAMRPVRRPVAGSWPMSSAMWCSRLHHRDRQSPAATLRRLRPLTCKCGRQRPQCSARRTTLYATPGAPQAF
jgi:hypothetical protein